MCFELHWDLESPLRAFHIDLEGLWARAVPTAVAGVDLLVLSPADLLLHLCVHTCKHRLTGGFRAFCDIAEVVRHYGAGINWDEFTARAWQWTVHTFVYVALRVSFDLLGAPVPPAVFNRLVPPGFDTGLVDIAKLEIFEDRLSASLFADFFRLRWGRTLGERVAGRKGALLADFSSAIRASRRFRQHEIEHPISDEHVGYCHDVAT
jgi:hypothetical protein